MRQGKQQLKSWGQEEGRKIPAGPSLRTVIRTPTGWGPSHIPPYTRPRAQHMVSDSYFSWNSWNVCFCTEQNCAQLTRSIGNPQSMDDIRRFMCGGLGPPTLIANERVDADAFQRAVALIAHQGTELLGAQEAGDYYWRLDETFFHRAHFARVLRSIGLLGSTQVLSTFEPPDYSQSSSDDIMDVLATTQPVSVNLAPSPTQLEAAARRLLDAGFSTTTYRLRHTELSTFFSLTSSAEGFECQMGQGLLLWVLRGRGSGG
ncbi:uncharacterized protein BO72DRAFT_502960 [Aspergillus fijiensis CBS 313.89]|uniref:Uncharacterized protein n=1 Tax=Aspergillus fijiensis CBS 313.89 TaxID=1448319 RepID=A0A8G1W174_9EURO|nr:uncharacterized protein BO72DRAFT_502960 [Aspergillus fijiensis CBS 313.89]RAK80132.1 hypothetical protein BO72DRAFT_502960 [Aspergillus fijiensis CBS 313.89]